jgi:hypothetical protein
MTWERTPFNTYLNHSAISRVVRKGKMLDCHCCRALIITHQVTLANLRYSVVMLLTGVLFNFLAWARQFCWVHCIRQQLPQVVCAAKHICAGRHTSNATYTLYERVHCTALISLCGLTDPTVSCSPTNVIVQYVVWTTNYQLAASALQTVQKLILSRLISD